MLTERQKQIVSVLFAIEDCEPDISTEQLFARVEDITGADASEISEALLIAEREEVQ